MVKIIVNHECWDKKFKVSEIIKNVENKNKNNIPLTDNEAIDLLSAPDSTHNYDMKKLLRITTRLLVKSRIHDKEFHEDLFDCQRRSKKIFEKNKRKKMENMINVKEIVKELGIKPNVTGFEESFNLAYLDGKREGYDDGKKDIIRKLLINGFNEKTVAENTNIPLKEIVKELGIRPNVTGFEESFNLAYLDGKRDGYSDGKKDIIRNLLINGFDEKTVAENTNIPLDEIRKIKRNL